MIFSLWIGCPSYHLGSHYHLARPRECDEIWQRTNDPRCAEIENIYCVLEVLLDLTVVIFLVTPLVLVDYRIMRI